MNCFRSVDGPQLELAQAVGLSQPAVAERIRKLEEGGYISGYTAVMDARSPGLDITAFIGVFTNHPRYHEGFVKQVTEIQEVLECHRVAGADSYLLKVKTANTSSLDSDCPIEEFEWRFECTRRRL